MGRHRHTRPKRQSPALIALVAFPLAFGTVSASLASRTGEAPEAAPAPETGAPYTDLLLTPPRPDLTPAVALRSRTVSDAPAGLIPWAALQSYRRAAGILAEVRADCGLPWTLVAAVGQVESDHGRAGGGELGDDATVRPAMVGPALDGRRGRAKVPDTDRGRQDGDRTWDRELGPMRLAPSVWDLAGVDGDGDGRRDVQDLDDAALATAVYLCASGEGLHKESGAAAALLSYRGDEAYVDRVLAVSARYQEGRFAVSAAPPLSATVPASLGLGPAVPVRQLTARAVTDVTRQLGGLPVSERDKASTEEVIAARPPRTRSPEAGPTPTTLPRPSGTPTAGEGPEGDTDPTPSTPGRPTGTPGDPSPTPDPANPTIEPDPGPTEEPTEEPPVEQPDDPSTDPPGEDPDDQPPADDPPAEQPPADDPPDEDPATTVVEGVWTVCTQDPPASGYCLDDAAVDLTVAGPLDSPATGDLDGDGATGTVSAELEGLVGRIVRLTVIVGSRPLKVVAIDDVALATP